MDSIIMQPVYMLFTGMGQTEYLCAPNDKAAREFVQKEHKGKITRYYSLYASNVYMRSGGTFWLRHGITISNPTDEADLLKDLKPKD